MRSTPTARAAGRAGLQVHALGVRYGLPILFQQDSQFHADFSLGNIMIPIGA